MEIIRTKTQIDFEYKRDNGHGQKVYYLTLFIQSEREREVEKEKHQTNSMACHN